MLDDESDSNSDAGIPVFTIISLNFTERSSHSGHSLVAVSKYSKSHIEFDFKFNYD